MLPAALIEFPLNSPRDYVIIHTCDACGLQVPIYSTWTNDSDPPPKLGRTPTAGGAGFVCPNRCGQAWFGPEGGDGLGAVAGVGPDFES